MIRDRNVDWKPGRWFLPGTTFNGDAYDAGAVALGEVSTFGYGAPLMAAAGDLVCHHTMVPNDWDPEYPLGFKVWWTSGSSTVADTISWKVAIDFKVEGETLIAPTTALDTVVALLDNVTGAYDQQKTARGIKNKSWLTRAQVDAGADMMFHVEMDAFAAGLSESKFLLGLEIDYVVRMTNS